MSVPGSADDAGAAWSASAPFQTPNGGLAASEVAARVSAGRTNVTDSRTSRTVLEIVRANIFTVFNAVLVTLVVVIAFTGRWQNGLFGLVVIANAAIGIVRGSPRIRSVPSSRRCSTAATSSR